MEHEFLYELLSSSGISGCEMKIQKKCADYMKSWAHEVRLEPNGNVVGILNPDSPVKILLAGHIDEIGLMVTAYTKEGFLRVAKAGGITPRMYPGHKVRIDTGKTCVYGSVVSTGELQKKEELLDTDLLIDIGAEDEEDAGNYVPVGSPVVFDTDWRPLANNCISARALDNRSGAYIVMEVLRRAREKGCRNGLFCATTVGEETSFCGGAWAGARIRPDMAIAVDVTFASDAPGGDEGIRGRVRLGGGPGLCIGTMSHPVMVGLLRKASERLGIKTQPVITPGRTFTDMDAIHMSGAGVPTALVNLPLRYMHTPSEVCSLKDIEDCIEMISEFVCMADEHTDLALFRV